MSEENYLKDISEIKNMMNKSSRFISLSGMSGVLAGIYALIGAFVASKMIREYSSIEYINEKSQMIRGNFNLIDLEINLILVAITVISLSIITGIVLSRNKAKKNGDNIWNKTSKRLLFNFLIPLITGGILCLVLLNNNIIGLIAPFTLIFYGLACVNASKYTIGDIQYLGITNIILGLVATQYIGYGLYFWAFGFGILHILYGTVMYFKYDKN
ncbi:MAG: hypothetical protein COB73_06140 [Flavobacteriaceae bacterium]|nr:MAG: hypothetical protein COB73_06140 [Flavobacteriaceae bacterium]